MKTLFVNLIIGFLSTAAYAIPGGTVANGGQTVLCQTPNKEVQSVESFDLYEGRVVYGHEYERHVGDPVQQAINMANKLDEAEKVIRASRADKRSIADRVRIVAKNMTINYGYKLPPTHDSKGYEIILNGCGLVPTINFYTEDLILVYGDAWDRLYDVDKAALYLHEAVYWHLRQKGVEKDSRRTRKAVSYVMSERTLESVSAMPTNVKSPIQYCHGKGTKFWAYKDAQDQLTLQFAEIGGYMMMTRTTMTANVPSATQLPIDAASVTPQVATGEVKSLLDKEMALQLSWSRGKISLKGQVQPKAKVNVDVVCQSL